MPTSFRSLSKFLHSVQRLWMLTLRRRSQKDRFGWQRLRPLTGRYWSKLEIRHPWPNQLFAVNHPRQEPDALACTPGSARGAPETGIPTELRIFLDNLKVLESPEARRWRRSWRQEMAAYLSPLSRDRPIAPESSGSAAFMNPHTRETVSVPAPVKSGLSRLNQFPKNRMPTNRKP